MNRDKALRVLLVLFGLIFGGWRLSLDYVCTQWLAKRIGRTPSRWALVSMSQWDFLAGGSA